MHNINLIYEMYILEGIQSYNDLIIFLIFRKNLRKINIYNIVF